MHFGYAAYSKDVKKFSDSTIDRNVRYLTKFFSFLDRKYKFQSIEPHEIKPIDVKEFLHTLNAEGYKKVTIQTYHFILKSWFDYMWTIGKIPYDFMPKLKIDLDLKSDSPKIRYNYHDYLKIKDDLITNAEIPLTTKMLFLFYLNGWRLREIVAVKIDDLIEYDDRFEVTKSFDEENEELVKKAIFKNREMDVIWSGIQRAVFNSTPYLFNSKVKGEYQQLAMGSLRAITLPISKQYELPLVASHLRIAFVHYLFYEVKWSEEEIADYLGIDKGKVLMLLKESIERLENVVYN